MPMFNLMTYMTDYNCKYQYLFWLVLMFCVCKGSEAEESGGCVSEPQGEKIDEVEERRSEAVLEQAPEAQEETEPDSGLGESSVEGGIRYPSIYGKASFCFDDSFALCYWCHWRSLGPFCDVPPEWP